MLNWNNLLQRSLSGALFLVVTIGMLYIGSITYFLFISLVITLALFEFSSMARKLQIRIPYLYVLLISLTIFTLYFLVSLEVIAPIWLSIIVIPLLFFLFVGELYRFHKKPIHNIAFSLLAIVYITIPLTLTNNFVFIEREDLLSGNFLDIRSYEGFFSDVLFFNPDRKVIYSPFIFLGFLSIIWIYDTFAYLFGVSFGKHRLFERVSPKKSWEGLIGGALVTMGLTVIFPLIFQILTWQNWLILSVIVIFSATMGDLVESLFKRTLDLKDSGNLIPGHGGVLDRFDSVLLATPAAFVYLQMLLQ